MENYITHTPVNLNIHELCVLRNTIIGTGWLDIQEQELLEKLTCALDALACQEV